MVKRKLNAHGSHKLLLITWQDAAVDNGWSAVGATPMTPSTVKSVGWLVSENDKCFVLGSDIGDSIDAPPDRTTETNRRIAIPKDWVIEIKDLK